VDEGVRPGDAFAPMHWTDQFSSSGPIDKLVHALTDPVSGQPDLKGTRVNVAAMTECWRGTLFRLDNGEPGLSDAVWWSMAQTRTGFAFELSGWQPLEKEVHSEQVLRRLLKISGEAELVSYSDPRRSVFRYAGFVRGQLAGCVFFAPPLQDFAGVEQAKSLLGKEVSAMDRISLLAGLEASGALSASKIVCACFSVSEAAIAGAIAEQGCRSPAEIGKALKAGTNCGSCIPEIKKLLGAPASATVA
jgi:assimilatory nitrate reductase catalytic subunit